MRAREAYGTNCGGLDAAAVADSVGTTGATRVEDELDKICRTGGRGEKLVAAVEPGRDLGVLLAVYLCGPVFFANSTPEVFTVTLL